MTGTPLADLPHAIAVIGLSGRFSGAPDADGLWRLLRQGRSGISRFTPAELEAAGVAKATFEHPDYVPAAGTIDDVDLFDATLFGFSAHEAALIDPQHRLFLECAWTALESAGYPPGVQPLAVGVFAGSSLGSYLSASPGDLGSGQGAAQLHGLIGNDKDYLTTRISHRLNLTGPSIGIQTACSTSLVAVHLAAQSLLSGECDMALAGGVSITIPQTAGYRYQDGLILSPDGRCRPFDAAAGGTLGGNGVGVVLLKPLAQALSDGDPIRAVIRGSAVNNDGSDKVGYTAPSIGGQMRVVREALAIAEAPATSIGYVEAHGTGTALGDPIEVEALTRAFAVDERGYCALGSVKSNLGHLDAAAGIASLIKTVLALEAGEVPPTLHYSRPNPRIDFSASPFFVADRLMPWPERGGPRRAGVSSFGFGGTNAHLILEQAPGGLDTGAPDVTEPTLLILSSGSVEQVGRLAGRHRDALLAGASPANIAMTAALHRRTFPVRAAILADDALALSSALAELSEGRIPKEGFTGTIAGDRPIRVAFQFSGQGGLSAGAAARLHARFPAFRDEIERCTAQRPEVRRFLLDREDAPGSTAEIVQPALFAYQLALVALWRSFGVIPATVLGHSVGELAAAVTSGALNAEEAWHFIEERGRLTAEAVLPGSMHAVMASEDRVRAALAPFTADVVIAAVNGPNECVLAGASALLDRISAAFEAEGVTTRQLAITHPFHCPNVDPMLPALHLAARRLVPRVPHTAFVSSRYGRALSDGEKLDASYWTTQLREPVRYADALKALEPTTFDAVLEIGPRSTLTKLGRRNAPDGVFTESADRGTDPVCAVLRTLGLLFCSGATLDWTVLYRGHPASPRRITAPTYPFARERHWHPDAGRLDGASDRKTAQLWDDVARSAEIHAEAGSPLVEPELHVSREAAVEDLAAAGAARALARLGFGESTEGAVSATEASDSLRIAPVHRQLVQRLLDGLVQAGRLTRTGDRFEALLAPDEAEVERLKHAAEASWQVWPAMRGITLEAVDRFADALAGRVDPREILFGDSSAATARAVYAEMPNARYFNGILRDALRAFVETWPRNRPLRVLEIGGGTAATTERLLPLLPPARTRYVFTDISPLFLRLAQARFIEYPFLETALFDVGKPPAGQGFEGGSFDLVVAANVLHVAPDLGEAVRHVRSLLAEGGLVLAYEIIRPTMIGEITTGLLLPEIVDAERRGVQPMASATVWQRTLGEAGFDAVAILPLDDRPAACLPERVLLARAGREGDRRDLDQTLPRDVAYRIEWSCVSSLRESASLIGEEWILAGDQIAEAQRIALEITRLGGRVITVSALADVETVAAFARTLHPDGGRRRFVDLRALDPSGASRPPGREQRRLCGGLLDILAGFEQAGVALGRLCVVTEGSQAVLHDETVTVEAAPLWGMARVVALGHPELACRQIDLDPAGPRDAGALICAITADVPEPLLALRGGTSYVPRLRRVRLDSLPERPFAVAVDGWHVIAGGLGGLGLTVARWLADQGARRIALLVRSEPNDRQRSSIEEIALAGVDIRALRADITNRDALGAAFDLLAKSGAPVRTIIHCAVARNVETGKEGWQSFADILAPKVDGAWALHEISVARSFSLDAFVLFSSSVSVAPAFGMPHYVAANTFLDALAHHRRSAGLPALSLSWGAWLDVGAVADPDHAEHLRRGGLRGFSPATGLALLDAALKRDVAHLALIDAEWPRMLRQYGEEQTPPIFSELIVRQRESSVSRRGTHERDVTFLERLRAAFPTERSEMLQAWLAAAFGVLLNRPAETVARDVNLIELGLDSLMFIDMASGLGTALGVKVSPSDLLRHFSVRAMAERLLPGLIEITSCPGSPALCEPALADLFVPRPDERYAPFPLTDVQQAYWIGRRRELELGNTACQGYTEFDCLDLDVPRLEAAWRRLIGRHEMLRMVILPDGQQRIIEAPPPYRIAITDLAGLSEKEREAQLEAIRYALSHKVRPTDLWPLSDVQVTRVDARRSRLHVGIDNVAIDGRSIGIVLSEWIALYSNIEAELPAPALSFRDYVLAFHAYRKTPGYARAQAYWHSQLSHLPAAPDLPLACNPSSITEPRFVRHTFQLKRECWDPLKMAASRRGLTAAALLLAAYAETLACWSKSPRLTINAPVFTRLPVHPGVNDVVGEFTSNTLVGLDLSGEDSFLDRARNVQAQLFHDLEHSVVSGIEVVRSMMRSGGDAKTSAMPVVFTSTFGLSRDNDTSYANNVAAFSAFGREVFSISQTPQVWLDNHVHDIDGGLGVNWDVVEGLFAPGVIEAMFAAYRGLLEGLASGEGEGGRDPWSDPRPVQLPMAQRAVRDMLNATAADLGPEGLLHAAVLAQARTTPNRIAVIDPERSLSYRTLAAEAEALAGELDVRLGPPAGSDELVAVALSKGWRQVVAVLAVLISGRAYMPLDPDLPDARQRAILAEGQPVAVLARGTLAAHASTETACPVLVVEPRPGAALAAHPPAPRSRPRDLAYVIFTSGSTGVPKGVMIEHRAALNTVRDVNARFGIGAEDGVFGLSSLSFDLSVYDLFGPLSCGGRLVLPAPGEARDPEAWAARLTREAVTVWNTVPALWQMLVEHAPRLPSPPRLVLLSGDWIPLDLIPRSRALFPSSRLVSLGGATEAAIWSVAHPVEEEAGSDWRSVPYGRPLANQRLHVLGPDLSPRPDWVVGDLFIAGDGLARGYWRDPVRTQTSFPVHPRSGERLYRTGDLARVRPDGTLEFLGREDQQVKVAGHRIELGEIEAALNRCDGVAGSVAAALGHPPGPRRLAAWIVATDASAPPAVETLRRSLADTLPAYMLPRTIALIDAIPLSQNGKIDRAKLPDIRDTDTETGGETLQTANEVALAAAWRAVLQSNAPGRADHFFEFGGNSLLAVRLVNTLRDDHQLSLPLSSVFAEPTLGRLARNLRPIRNGDGLVLSPLRDGDGEGPVLFCVSDALSEGGVFRALAGAWRDARPLVSVPGRIEGEGDDALSRHVAAVIAAIRLRQPRGPYTFIGYSTGGLIAWEIAAALERAGEIVHGVALVDSRPLPSSLAQDEAALRRILDHGGSSGASIHVLRRTVAAVARARLAPLQGPTLLLEAASRPPHLNAPHDAWRDAWRQGGTVHSGHLRRATIGGDHFTCLQPPHVAALADRLAQMFAASIEEPV
ncbi:Phthiocerol/phenolphthiocerol synthesis polyketide synthase type I PpsE [Methylobacterium bullatum]|uniref:Phthiocerol/phenolphthiocerol synthesis polyketide synthase type I PpsE n=1 Tax=Methylobacterium bullatum TaxID=570505 RepID=A0A679JB33_9HYPH|nr:Phthiocerol/phenolphthiocerol synthesis polyketide synthase type I PpsE [Methylobacterium bullatum]